MRRHRTAAVAALVLAVTAGLPLAGAAHADTTDLYVDQNAKTCSDTATDAGSQATPYCTASAAAAVVQPGQTIHLGVGRYADLHLTRSGKPGAPITVEGSVPPPDSADYTYLSSPGDSVGVSLDGVHDIALKHLSVPFQETGVLVTGSSRIELDDLKVDYSYEDESASGHPANPTGVRITGGSSDVTLSRSSSSVQWGTGVVVEPGVTGAVITTNDIGYTTEGGILVTGAPGTVVTSNTVHSASGSDIAVAGGSTGTVIENNVLTSEFDGSFPSGLSVAADSVSATKADYNVTQAGLPSPYSWGGTSYPDQKAFTTATGQGAHDLVGKNRDELLHPGVDSVVVDSADPDAPGELSTDTWGHTRTHVPGRPGTVAADRGAFEYLAPLTVSHSVQAVSPLTATFTFQAVSPWATGSNFTVDFGDGSPVVNAATSPLTHTYPAMKTYPLTITATDSLGQVQADRQDVNAGYWASAFVPTKPTRILDTRRWERPVGPGGVVKMQVAGMPGLPAAGKITAVLVNLTATQPTANSFVTAYAGGSARPTVSSLNFAAGQTVANAVVVPVSPDGFVSLYNLAGNVQLIADVQGYFTADPASHGNHLGTFTPTRALDTRTTHSPLGPSGIVKVKVRGGTGLLPDTARAVVLNLTATQPSEPGYVTAAPDKTPPSSSSINFAAGQTVANQVTAPIDPDGTVTLYNHNGTVHLIADIQAYYAAPGPDTKPLTTVAPTRLLDTRTDHTTLGPDHTVRVKVTGVANVPAGAKGVLVNLTATRPTAAGFLSAYAAGAARPNTSILNFTAGQTVPNLAFVPVSTDGYIEIYNHTGTTDVLVDLQGYTA